MPPIRFLHAAGIDPDAVLPRLPTSSDDIVDAAPSTAIERLIDRAIDLQVDFLILSPALQAAMTPPGFRSILALRRELARLTPHAIPVFLAVGTADSGWTQLVDRDSSITLLPAGQSAPLTDRDGRPFGRICCVAATGNGGTTTALPACDDDAVLVAPSLSIDDLDDRFHDRAPRSVRYFACGSGPRRSMPLESGLAHSPGTLQALSPADCGPHGATLITLDEDRSVQTELVPVASVRYESLAVRARPAESLDDLALRMSERLAEQRSEVGEQLWNVRWTIEAGGELFEALFDPVQRSMLNGVLPESTGDAQIVHRLVVVPHPFWPAVDDPFAAEFAAALVDQETELNDLAARQSLLNLPENFAHRQRFELLLAETDVASAIAQARRLGLRVVTAARETQDG